jgi:phage tail P2-like protein
MSETPTLLPLNSTRLERALATVIHRRLDAIPVPIRDLWDADQCPAPLLGWLAWSLSVDVWEENWSEATKRAVIRENFSVHVHKGTVGAVRRALSALNIGADITEWWQDGSARGTFRIDAFADQIFAAGGGIDAKLLAMVHAVVERTKRASQHYTLRVGEKFPMPVYARTASRIRGVDRAAQSFQPEPALNTGSVFARTASRIRGVDRTSHLFAGAAI